MTFCETIIIWLLELLQDYIYTREYGCVFTNMRSKTLNPIMDQMKKNMRFISVRD